MQYNYHYQYHYHSSYLPIGLFAHMLTPNAQDIQPTKVKHVVPALTEDVPGFRDQLVQPTWHGHCKKRHHKHGVYGLDETFCLFRNNRIQATDSRFEQHRGNACKKKNGKKIRK